MSFKLHIRKVKTPWIVKIQTISIDIKNLPFFSLERKLRQSVVVKQRGSQHFLKKNLN